MDPRNAAQQNVPDAGGRQRWVVTGGSELAVFEYGREPGPGVPTVVLVHGYPDDHRVFLGVLSELAATHHLVAFDTRNAGSSTATSAAASLKEFGLPALVSDLFAVLDAIGVPGVHLVGHDWGSIQGWAALQDPRAHGAVSRFTSVSGPDLGHFRRWTRRRLRRPRQWPGLAGQLARSWYVGFFQLPFLPELVWRAGLRQRYEASTGRDIGDNPVRGLALYRALKSPAGRSGISGRVRVPVHVVVPLKDPFLSPSLVEGLDEWVDELTVTTVESGHWWPELRPAEFAAVLRSAPRGHG
jgi:pimeloyl-ACP methyl ester carboxylesterase